MNFIGLVYDLSTTIYKSVYSVFIEATSFWAKKAYSAFWEPITLKKDYEYRMKTATTYKEWKDAAFLLDELEGNEKWKKEPESPDYDFELIQDRLSQLRQARKLNDLNALAFLLRTSITRNIGDLGNKKLYSQCYIGTKHLIEEYTNEVGELLQFCAIESQGKMDLKYQIELFKNIRHSYGNTALLLSGGATLGTHHIGVLKCLYEEKLIPRIISGSSSGSIMAAMICTRVDSEFQQVFNPNNVNLNILEEPTAPMMKHKIMYRIFRKLRRLVSQGVIFDSEVLRRCMQHNLGNVTFLEAYNRTRRVLNITVSSSTMFEMSRLLNYITAPNVLIWSAIVASCAIPTFFKYGKLLAKTKNGDFVPWSGMDENWIDGSVENDLPIKRLAQLFNVNHFIVSQVNPHVVPFLSKSLKVSIMDTLYRKLLFLIKSELQYRLPMMIEFKVFPTFCHYLLSVISQRYEGDITIVPDTIELKDIITIFSSLNCERVNEGILRGEKATWPKLSIIRNHTWIEIKLDEILYSLKCKLIDAKKNEAIGILELDSEKEFYIDKVVIEDKFEEYRTDSYVENEHMLFNQQLEFPNEIESVKLEYSNLKGIEINRNRRDSLSTMRRESVSNITQYIVSSPLTSSYSESNLT